MGCVYSHNENNKQKRAQQPPGPRKRPQPPNSRPSEVTKPKPVNNGVIKNGSLPKNTGEKNFNNLENDLKNQPLSPLTKTGEAAEDVAFSRQHFDRNSVIRRSKKRPRKNSTASNNTSINQSSNNHATSPRSPNVSTVEKNEPVVSGYKIQVIFLIRIMV